MTLDRALFRYAVPLSGDYVIVVQDESNPPENIDVTFDPTVEWFMLGDGSAQDALAVLAAAISTHSAVTTIDLTIDADFHVELTHTGPASLTLLWTDGDNTLDGTILGWPSGEDSDPIPDTDPYQSPNVPMGIVQLGRPVSEDSRPRQGIVGGIARSVSGLTRASRFALPRKERSLSVSLMRQEVALDEYASSDAPYGTIESMHVRSLSLGRAAHYVPDDLSPFNYSVIRLAPPLRDGLVRDPRYRLRWHWDANFIVESLVP